MEECKMILNPNERQIELLRRFKVLDKRIIDRQKRVVEVTMKKPFEIVQANNGLWNIVYRNTVIGRLQKTFDFTGWIAWSTINSLSFLDTSTRSTSKNLAAAKLVAQINEDNMR